MDMFGWILLRYGVLSPHGSYQPPRFIVAALTARREMNKMRQCLAGNRRLIGLKDLISHRKMFSV